MSTPDREGEDRTDGGKRHSLDTTILRIREREREEGGRKKSEEIRERWLVRRPRERDISTR